MTMTDQQKFESKELDIDKISISNIDIISVLKEHDIKATNEEISSIAKNIEKVMNKKIEKISDEWESVTIDSIEKILGVEV